MRKYYLQKGIIFIAVVVGLERSQGLAVVRSINEASNSPKSQSPIFRQVTPLKSLLELGTSTPFVRKNQDTLIATALRSSKSVSDFLQNEPIPADSDTFEEDLTIVESLTKKALLDVERAILSSSPRRRVSASHLRGLRRVLIQVQGVAKGRINPSESTEKFITELIQIQTKVHRITRLPL
jgi:hypothetical protein